jgi:lysophospholipase L1-like esterase
VYLLTPEQKHPPAKKHHWFLKAILLVSSWIILAVLLIFPVEFFVRYHYRDVLSTPDGRSYFFMRSYPLFKAEFNGYQLRGKAFPAEHDDRYKIAAMGDSFTYGQGVYPADKRYTEQVEKLLNQDRPEHDILVANTGICGFNLREYNNYAPFIDQLHPDYVLYQWFLNDMDSRPDLSAFVTPRLLSNRNAHEYLYSRSALYYLLQRAYGQLRVLKGRQQTYPDYLVDRFQDPNNRYSKDAEELLIRLIQHFKTAGTEFGIVLFPGFHGPMIDYRPDFLHERVMETCRQYGIDCLDLRATYQEVPFRDLWANRFDPHPGVLAHKMAAKAIYDHFGHHWKEKAELLHRDGQQSQLYPQHGAISGT